MSDNNKNMCACGHHALHHDVWDRNGRHGYGSCQAVEPDTRIPCDCPLYSPVAVVHVTESFPTDPGCPRCNRDHDKTPLGIALECPAVASVQWSDQGNVESIVFRETPGLVLHSGYSAEDIQQMNSRLDNAMHRIGKIEVALDGSVCAKCGHGEQWHNSNNSCIAGVHGKLCGCPIFHHF